MHHINCTFYDALGRRDDEYFVARAIQCFLPGLPQVYYVGLFAGGNDMELLRRTGVGRDINRHYYSADELQLALSRPVVRAMLDLLRFRNTHAAFAGTFELLPSAAHVLTVQWHNGGKWARLDVNLTEMRASITAGDRRRHVCRHAGRGGGIRLTRLAADRRSLAAVKGLTYAMFAMFAMTTDSVGLIIPEVIRTFHLSLTAAGAFQYATMGGIAVAGLFLGSLADRFGHRRVLVAGLTLFAASSFPFLAGDSFLFFAVLMGLSGVAIAVFKTAALTLVGDISTSTAQHTAIMNTAEGFFGIGSIVGPAILARLLGASVSWQWLYVIAGSICVLLIITALQVKYPQSVKSSAGMGSGGTATAIQDRYVLAFSTGIFLYVAIEAAIYVWMPTLFTAWNASTGGASASPAWVAAYSLPIFFLLRAGGRFLGAWMLTRVRWQAVLMIFSGAIFLSFLASVTMGVTWAVYLLPLSGLFMSVMYPTLNSKGISCLPRRDHGAAAGVILFFTCVSAVFAPLAMGAAGDSMGHIVYGFWLAAGCAGLLFAGLLLNWIFDPTRAVLERLNVTEYQQA